MSARNEVHIEIARIGDADKQNLCSTLLSAIERFYADPVNRERAERWIAAKQNGGK